MFTNWIGYTKDEAYQEYHVEYELKSLSETEMWPRFEDFYTALRSAKVVDLTPALDSTVMNRSRTSSKEALLSLIKSYRSYPKFRNEETINKLYEGFRTNAPMKMPMLIEFKDGTRRIFAGNTRLDVAFQLGITPKVLIITE